MTPTSPLDTDLLIVGGGINGAGIAADAAGRGLRVILCEKGDLGGATSSASSKLIHGGLRYLEQREFKLVHAALKERQVLLKKAPHIMRPLCFRLPHQPHLRPTWLIRLGLFLYDQLAWGNRLSSSKKIRCDNKGPLIPEITTCFEYVDGWVDDARLVILNALAAQDKGARILVRTTFISAKKLNGRWHAILKDAEGREQIVASTTIVNASGPWVESTLHDIECATEANSVRLVKGSHIVVPQLYPSDEAYILQNEDKRIVFVIPYENHFSLIGTTDVDYTGDPGDVHICDAEKTYLLDIVNRYFLHQTAPEEIVYSFSGVRPLLEEENTSAQAVSRDYRIEIVGAPHVPVMLNVFGGKITTYRRLAEQALNKLSKFFPHAGPAWTSSVPLPGGNFSDKPSLKYEYQQRYPWLSGKLIEEYVARYGRLCEKFLDPLSTADELGEHFGHGLFQAEVDYLCRSEWAHTADDILWRRTKKGLWFSENEVNRLKNYLAAQQSQPIQQ
ncbi:glycerol-3-phosphate dehydrogenase [Alteromonas ponticola]|uniref:Glycerol-3-phosphate dehydrogenase n=1 Tax=Alteromonas aquimaris TaxID=2998417 RepID=A0ABT3P8L7_9ALTE|nr:glycerol-3-phosphate dehydrogenase [Alteromonas aquimaris]MCW8109112.1 glycerol-3-phosphate dehydrogenase [Alteromonas aquimaris]